MEHSLNEKGFVHLLAVIVGAVIFLGVLSIIPVNRHYASGSSNVAGVTSTPSTGGVKLLASESQTAFVQGISGAISNYSVKVENGVVLVNTPSGIKQVTILPDTAAKSALYSGVMDTIRSVAPQGVFASVNQLAKLDEKDKVLGYTFEGNKEVKVLGVIPVKTHVTAFVSAENGQVVETTTSLLGRILSHI